MFSKLSYLSVTATVVLAMMGSPSRANPTFSEMDWQYDSNELIRSDYFKNTTFVPENRSQFVLSPPNWRNYDQSSWTMEEEINQFSRSSPQSVAKQVPSANLMGDSPVEVKTDVPSANLMGDSPAEVETDVPSANLIESQGELRENRASGATVAETQATFIEESSATVNGAESSENREVIPDSVSGEQQGENTANTANLANSTQELGEIPPTNSLGDTQTDVSDANLGNNSEELSEESLNATNLAENSQEIPQQSSPANLSNAQADFIEEVPPGNLLEDTSIVQRNLSYISPLREFAGVQSTANQLGKGEVTFNANSRVFFIPDSLAENATPIYFGGGFSWGISDNFELSLQAQFVDTGLPYRQGPFEANTISDVSTARIDLMIEGKQRIWQNEADNLAISGVFSLDWADGNYRFRDSQTREIVAQDSVQTLVPTLKVPVTFDISNDFQLTVSPTVAFFPNSSALFFFRAPVENPGSFGTTFGFTAGLSYEVTPRTLIWADGFFPVTGNNSVSRASGQTAKAIAYNTGIRYLVNPRLAVDVFATNSLGSKGALALTADRDFMALGIGMKFMPDFMANNRNYADSFAPQWTEKGTTVRGYGLGLAERSNLNARNFRIDILGGSNGVLGNISYSFVKDLEMGIYLDYVFSQIDESEQGLSAKLRLLNQAEGAPLTINLAATLGQTNEPYVNYINNNRQVASQRGFGNSVPNVFETDVLFEGRLKIVTVSLPLTYDFNEEMGAAIWLTPTFGYVQTLGVELAGFNAGGLIPLGSEFSLIGEIGQNFAGEGNGFIGEVLRNATPWTVAIRWNPTNFRLNPNSVPLQSHFELYITNRVGFTPWLQMRVRDQNDTAVGASLMIPF
ncbi:MAG: hypothetical protein AB4041_10340 [Microcystaceae cyanobacterium]